VDLQARARHAGARIYGSEISERHRHRYEFNREYEAVLTGAGLRISGSDAGRHLRRDRRDAGSSLVLLGCQFHPEFKSKPLEPHPLFVR
jgi:CTP synthase